MNKKLDLSKCMTLKNHQLALEIELGEMEVDEEEKYFVGYESYKNDLRSLHNAILTCRESLTHCCITLASGRKC